MKYIDADLLRERIGKNQYVIEPMFLKGDDSYYEGEYDGYNRILSIIDSLQQEQPEVDLKKEIETYFKGWYMDETDQGYILHTPDDHAGLMSVKQIARHFYELGLNAKEE